MTFFPPPRAGGYQIIVEAAFGSNIASDPATYVWTDVSRYVRGSVTISKGKAYQPGQIVAAAPCQVSFTLDNNKGYFTPENPLSPYYPNVIIGTPVRVRLTWPGATSTYERITAFVTGWPIVPNAGMLDVVSPIVAQGRLRWVMRPGKAIRSPLFGTIRGAGPIAYWPMEDPSTVTSCVSAVVANSPLRPFNGSPTLGATGPAGAAAAVDFHSGGSMVGAVTGGSTTGWTVEMQMRLAAADDPGTSHLQRFIDINTTGTDSLYQLGHSVLGGASLLVYRPDGTNDVFLNDSTVPQYDDTWHSYVITGHQNGSNVDVTVSVDGTTVVSGTATGQTLGRVQSVTLVPQTFNYLASAQGSIDHVAVYNGVLAIDHTAALGGYVGELATDRVTRICAQLGIPVVVTA